MKIDLSNLFNGSEEVVKIDYKLSLSDLLYGTYNPIKNDVKVTGQVFSKADVVYLESNISFVFDGFCDRCAEEIVKEYSFDVNKILVPELESDEDFDNYLVVSNHTLDVDDLVNEEIQLLLPSKMLCKTDCKGLCHKCGKNLNNGKCDCKDDIDPRMSALLQLLDEE